MSKNINVNPDHYKTAGRERQGEDIVQHQHKIRFSRAHTELSGRAEQRTASLASMAATARTSTPRKPVEHDSGKRSSAPKKGNAKSARGRTAAKTKPAAKRKPAAKKKPATKRAAAGKAKTASRTPPRKKK
ncbi:MAG TPA: hypothetical protein VMS56_11315 [Thermoanaerobaculia bacterium]|nr:hypothetical protein [Thermoanaerobaculia bacterium]